MLHDLPHDFYVPAPGRVQYYRAECLPFIPDEVKCQLRFPKAYTGSQRNMRYLDQVREQTQLFTKSKISHNYFTGEQDIPLTSTLEEIEVLNAANDEVKSMAASGALKQIHDKFASLQEQSEAEYIQTRDKIENIIAAVQSKED
jgi:hypothetical protein